MLPPLAFQCMEKEHAPESQQFYCSLCVTEFHHILYFNNLFIGGREVSTQSFWGVVFHEATSDPLFQVSLQSLSHCSQSEICFDLLRLSSLSLFSWREKLVVCQTHFSLCPGSTVSLFLEVSVAGNCGHWLSSSQGTVNRTNIPHFLNCPIRPSHNLMPDPLFPQPPTEWRIHWVSFKWEAKPQMEEALVLE